MGVLSAVARVGSKTSKSASKSVSSFDFKSMAKLDVPKAPTPSSTSFDFGSMTPVTPKEVEAGVFSAMSLTDKSIAANKKNPLLAITLKQPVTIKDGGRLSGFTGTDKKHMYGYDKNGELFSIEVGKIPDDFITGSAKGGEKQAGAIRNFIKDSKKATAGAIAGGLLSQEALASEDSEPEAQAIQPFDFKSLEPLDIGAVAKPAVRDEVLEPLTGMKKDEELPSLSREDPNAVDSNDLSTKARTSEVSQLRLDEGEVKNNGSHVSYDDSLGKPTGGHGHLLTKTEQKKYPKDTAIPDDVVNKWLEVDLEEANTDLDKLLESKSLIVPDEVEQILFNMVFNLGRTRLGKFKKMWDAIDNQDYETAADEMVDSEWFKQVGDRSKRLVQRMRDIK